MSQNNGPKASRRRGVILTSQGLQKLQTARSEAEFQENLGHPFTLEAQGDRTGLSVDTLMKVFACEAKVDKQTLKTCFRAFGLTLEAKDYFLPSASPPQPPLQATLSAHRRRDWAEAVDVSHFWGREEELPKLAYWILQERCPIVGLLGMGGIGKTTLSIKLAHQVESDFEIILWRSLRNAPSFSELLSNILQSLSVSEAPAALSIENQKLQLLDYLRQHRCLLILDNLESLLVSGEGKPYDHAGCFQARYAAYGEFLKLMGATAHQSCLVLTSREKPRELAALEGNTPAIRALRLQGLAPIDARAMLQNKGYLQGSEQDWQQLIRACGGNPLALKITATTIEELFDRNITKFLKQKTIAFGGVRRLLDEQFQRLSDLELDILYWLGLSRGPVSLQDLKANILAPVRNSALLESIESLRRRSLVEPSAGCLTLQPVVMEYITDRFIEAVCQEIAHPTSDPRYLKSHALIQTQTADYIREAQVNLILKPILQCLENLLGCSNPIEAALNQLLSQYRDLSAGQTGYTVGNVINLLREAGADLSDRDFSSLAIWQADFKNINLVGTNLAHADLSKTVFTEAMGGIYSVAFSANGPLLASGGDDGFIRLWQPLEGRQILSWNIGDFWIFSVAFSPDGQLLATGSNEATIKLWEVQTGRCLKTLTGHTNLVFSVAFSPDGQYLATGSTDQTVRLWDVITGKCLRVLSDHNQGALSVTFSPDGHYLAVASHDQGVKLWNLRTGEGNLCFQGHTNLVFSVAFSPDGQYLATGSHDLTLRLWEVTTGHCLRVLRGHRQVVYGVTFSPDGQWLVSGSADQTLRVWDVKTGECQRVLSSAGNCCWSLAFEPQTDSTDSVDFSNFWLASGGTDPTIKLWDIPTGQCHRTLQGSPGGFLSLAIAPQEPLLASASEDKTIRLWDLTRGECRQVLMGHLNWAWSVAFSPDGQLLASASEDSTIRLWEVRTGRCLQILEGHGNGVSSACFAPQEKWLATGGHDHTVRLWELSTGQGLKILEGHANWIWFVTFSPDGRLLASGGEDQSVRLWQTETGQCLQILEGHTNSVISVAFSPDGRLLASGSSDHCVKLWQPETGQCLRTLQGHCNKVWAVAFSLDGDILATGSHDRTIRLWNPQTGECLQILQGHESSVWAVAFHPDGKTLISGSKDETLRIWEIKTGQCLKTLQVPKIYQGMNITGATGLTTAQRASLKQLGAIETDSDSLGF